MVWRIWAVSAAICELSEDAADLPALIWLWRSPALEAVSLVPSSIAATTRTAAALAALRRWLTEDMQTDVSNTKVARAPGNSGAAAAVRPPGRKPAAP